MRTENENSQGQEETVPINKPEDISDENRFSRYDCAELDQDHNIVEGRCSTCGKWFKRKEKS